MSYQNKDQLQDRAYRKYLLWPTETNF